ncbi:MAG: haloacid dehalogenase-like hydrolase [Candidatus Dormibacteria bacterium]|jgi:phosphoglycolate phosphatase-like HAD superfamily hydrolase
MGDDALGGGPAPVASERWRAKAASADRLVLWDIDGTLMRAGEIAAVVFERAIEQVLGTRPSRRLRMAGKTDPQIVREHLALADLSDADRYVEAILARAEVELAGARDLITQHGTVKPGVLDLLRRLDQDDRFLQSVVTGNITANAAVKLGALGLDAWLDLEIGAYGSDSAERRDLVPIAMARAERLRDRRFEPGQVWIIGDTGNDLACARAAGARCLLVATGGETLEALQALDADAVLADLSDTQAVHRLLAGTDTAIDTGP